MKLIQGYFLLIGLLSFMLLASTNSLFAQDAIPPDAVDWQAALAALLGKYFATATAFSGFVTLITAWLLKYVNITKALYKQLFAIGLGVLFALGGYFTELGIFADMTFAGALITGVNVGMGSNSIYDLFRGLFSRKKQ